MSTSRSGWTELTSSARRTSSSVVLPMALTTTTTSLPARRVRATWSATARMRSASPTDVPPNFWTTRDMARKATARRPGAPGPDLRPPPARSAGALRSPRSGPATLHTVGTEKRERQKAGRQARREAEQKAAKRKRGIRRGITIAIAVAVVVGVSVLLFKPGRQVDDHADDHDHHDRAGLGGPGRPPTGRPRPPAARRARPPPCPTRSSRRPPMTIDTVEDVHGDHQDRRRAPSWPRSTPRRRRWPSTASSSWPTRSTTTASPSTGSSPSS